MVEDAEHDLRAKYWLVGTVLAAAGSLLAVTAVCLQRRAHVRAQGRDLRSSGVSGELPPNLLWLVASSALWLAFLFVGVARFWAPGITVATVQTFAPLVNAAFAPALLLERYGLRDVVLTCIAIIGALIATSTQTSNHEYARPDDDLNLTNAFPMSHNEDFIIYCVVWIAVVIIGLIVNSIMRCSSASLYLSESQHPMDASQWHGLYRTKIQRFTLPLLTGFFFAAWQTFFCIAVEIVTDNGHLRIDGSGFLTWSPERPKWSDVVTLSFTILVLGLAGMSGGLAFSHFDAGAQVFESRYFTTTSLCVCLATISSADVLFSGKWMHMGTTSALTFCFANSISLLAAFLVSSEETKGLYADSQMGRQQSEQNQLGNVYEGNQAESAQMVTVSPGPATAATTDSCWYQVWFAFCRALPMLILLQVPAVYAIFFFGSEHHTWFCFCMLTVYSCWSTWQFGFHILLFSIGGQRKVGIAKGRSRTRSIDVTMEDMMRKPDVESSDQYYHRAPSQQQTVHLQEQLLMDVYHFVVLASYKEHMHIMREAVDSVAASPLAAGQIIMVFAMEEREKESREKGEAMVSEYRDSFKDIFATFHPKDIPGEVPSKASNMHWACARISEYVRASPDINESQVLFTVADADSNFHPNYFEAITEEYISIGVKQEDKTVIWQAPMMHFKNYGELPNIVRVPVLAAVVHEIAVLSDPMLHSTAMPFSTYSIPLKFLQAVGDFDPDWVSEDWHIGIKLRLATMGKCQFRPIFLPVLNYGPEDSTWLLTVYARWQQAQRHALAYTELTYIWASIPLAWASFANKPHRLTNLGTYMWQCVIPLSFKVFSVHAFVGFMPLLLPLNGYMLRHFWSTNAQTCIGSWVYMIDLIALSTNPLFVLGSFWSCAFLFDQQKHNTVYYSTDAWWLKYKSVHCLRIAFDMSIYVVSFFYAFCLAEWLAAWSGMRTHRFEHNVAPKQEEKENSSAPSLKKSMPSIPSGVNLAGIHNNQVERQLSGE